MPQIVAVRAKDDASRDLITVVLSQDAVWLGPDGEPWAGVSLNAQLVVLRPIPSSRVAANIPATPSFRIGLALRTYQLMFFSRLRLLSIFFYSPLHFEIP